MAVRELNITLPEAMVDAIEDRVKAGRYGSTDEVMLAAIDALLREENEYGERIESIRQQISRSIDDPSPSLSSTEMRAHVERLFTRHRG